MTIMLIVRVLLYINMEVLIAEYSFYFLNNEIDLCGALQTLHPRVMRCHWYLYLNILQCSSTRV